MNYDKYNTDIKNFVSFYVYGTIQYRNSGMKFLKDEIRDEILEFIAERLKKENFTK